MKSCPKCKRSYPDTENYCIHCGTRLAAKKPREWIKPVKPPRDITVLKRKMDKLERDASPRQFAKLSKKIDALEQRMNATILLARKTSRIKFPPEERMISLSAKVKKLEQKLDSVNGTVYGLEKIKLEPEIHKALRAKINGLERELKRVEKNTRRMVEIKSLPKKEAMSIVDEIGKLERKADAMGEAADYGRSIEKLKKMVETADSKIMGLTDFIKDNEGSLGGIEKGLKGVVRRVDLKDFQEKVIGDMDSLNEEVRRKISSDSAMIKKISRKLKEQDKFITDFTKTWESLGKFKERMLLLIGLTLQEKKKSRRIKNRLRIMVEKRMAEIREQNDLLTKAMEARFDEAKADVSKDVRDLGLRFDEELQSVNETLANKEKRISAKLSSISKDAISKKELEDFRREFGVEKARVFDVVDQLVDQGKIIEELENVKENLISEQRLKISGFGAGLRQELDKMKAEHGEAVSSLKESESKFKTSMKKLRKEMWEETRTNEKLREDMSAMLGEFRTIGSDSQEKLGMVKGVIDNLEKRFRVEIESLEEKLEKMRKIIKIQEKQESDRISPLNLGKETRIVKKPGK